MDRDQQQLAAGRPGEQRPEGRRIATLWIPVDGSDDEGARGSGGIVGDRFEPVLRSR